MEKDCQIEGFTIWAGGGDFFQIMDQGVVTFYGLKNQTGINSLNEILDTENLL